MRATRTESLASAHHECLRALVGSTVAFVGVPLGGACRRMWALFLGAFGRVAHTGACPRSLRVEELVGACGRRFIGCLWTRVGGTVGSLHECLRALVGALGGRLWVEVLRAFFMSACGRLWALVGSSVALLRAHSVGAYMTGV